MHHCLVNFNKLIDCSEFYKHGRQFDIKNHLENEQVNTFFKKLDRQKTQCPSTLWRSLTWNPHSSIHNAYSLPFPPLFFLTCTSFCSVLMSGWAKKSTFLADCLLFLRVCCLRIGASNLTSRKLIKLWMFHYKTLHHKLVAGARMHIWSMWGVLNVPS
jgi:hypothetical protein